MRHDVEAFLVGLVVRIDRLCKIEVSQVLGARMLVQCVLTAMYSAPCAGADI